MQASSSGNYIAKEALKNSFVQQSPSELTFGVKDTVSAQAYLGYRIPIQDRHLNLRVGYRYLEQDYKSTDFHWDMRQHGAVVGVNLPIF